jgi:hypothetical protein
MFAQCLCGLRQHFFRDQSFEIGGFSAEDRVEIENSVAMNCAIASGVVEQEANESHGVSFKLKRRVAH